MARNRAAQQTFESCWGGRQQAAAYFFAATESATDAGTARSRAQARSLAMSSARVIDSGTVSRIASSTVCVVSGFLSVKAAYSDAWTAASISAPEYPSA